MDDDSALLADLDPRHVRAYLLDLPNRRYMLECALCLDEDPDRLAGHVVIHPSDAEALRVMRNHLAQRHDILPTASPGDRDDRQP